MKFAMSYSCGKDSTLAFHKMLEQGHEPVCLVVLVKLQLTGQWVTCPLAFFCIVKRRLIVVILLFNFNNRLDKKVSGYDKKIQAASSIMGISYKSTK